MKHLRSAHSNNSTTIPMSAMIDVVFLLLIFFIMTYQEDIIESHVSINKTVMSKSSVTNPQHTELMEVHVLPNSYKLMGNQSMNLPELTKNLSTYYNYDSDLSLIIKVDGSAEHKVLVSLLDRCKKIGLTKLNITMLNERS